MSWFKSGSRIPGIPPGGDTRPSGPTMIDSRHFLPLFPQISPVRALSYKPTTPRTYAMGVCTPWGTDSFRIVGNRSSKRRRRRRTNYFSKLHLMIVMEAESVADRDPDPGQEPPPDPKETSADVDLRSLRVNAQSVLA